MIKNLTDPFTARSFSTPSLNWGKDEEEGVQEYIVVQLCVYTYDLENIEDVGF